MGDEKTWTETIVKYAKRASQAESRVSKLEGRLNMLEMGITAAQAPPGYAPEPALHTAYLAPAAPTVQTQQPPKTIAFQPPPRKHSGYHPKNRSGYHSADVRVEEDAL